MRDGKIHQVIGAVVDGMPNIPQAEKMPCQDGALSHDMRNCILTRFVCIVKFDSDQLPPILNALETDNGGTKLILEVAVRWRSDVTTV